MSYERYTDLARRVIVVSQDIARQMGHGFIGTEHILTALLMKGYGGEPIGGVAQEALDSLQLDFDAVWRYVETLNETTPASTSIQSRLPFSQEASTAREETLRQALQLQHNYIGPGHLLLGVIETEGATAVKVLANWQVTPRLLRERLISLMTERERAWREDPRYLPPVPREWGPTEGLTESPEAAWEQLDAEFGRAINDAKAQLRALRRVRRLFRRAFGERRAQQG